MSARRRGGRRMTGGSLLLTAMLIATPRDSPLAQPPDSTAARQAYRTPVIAIVQPAAGAAIPQDKPVVLFRFAAGERDDPVDMQTFKVSVDGADATSSFQVAVDKAWGALPTPPDRGSSAIAPGAHLIAARICSVRGACGSLQTTVIVAPSDMPEASPKASRKARLIDLLIEAARRILIP